MSDAGLKPVLVYHNLSPAELYEKASGGGTAGQRLGSGEAEAPATAAPEFTAPASLLPPAIPTPCHVTTAKQALEFEPTSHIVAGGALATLSGAKTGRTWVAAGRVHSCCGCKMFGADGSLSSL